MIRYIMPNKLFNHCHYSTYMHNKNLGKALSGRQNPVVG